MSLNIGNTFDEMKAEAPHYKKVIIGFIDIILSCVLFALLPLDNWAEPFYRLPFPFDTVLLSASLAFYRMITLLLFNGTVGMKLLGVTFLSGEGLSLSLKEKLLASFFILYKGVGYYNR